MARCIARLFHSPFSPEHVTVLCTCNARWPCYRGALAARPSAPKQGAPARSASERLISSRGEFRPGLRRAVRRGAAAVWDAHDGGPVHQGRQQSVRVPLCVDGRVPAGTGDVGRAVREQPGRFRPGAEHQRRLEPDVAARRERRQRRRLCRDAGHAGRGLPRSGADAARDPQRRRQRTGVSLHPVGRRSQSGGRSARRRAFDGFSFSGAVSLSAAVVLRNLALVVEADIRVSSRDGVSLRFDQAGETGIRLEQRLAGAVHVGAVKERWRSPIRR